MPILRLAIVVLAVLALCDQALAQFGGSRRGGGGGAGSGSRRDSGELSGVTRLSANDHIRMQVADARLALRLTPEQNPLFDAYQAKVLDLLPDSGGGKPVPDESALRQIDLKVDAARHRLSAMEGLSRAAKNLYAALSEEQKQIADRMLPGTVP